jgi:hypothetical protein
MGGGVLTFLSMDLILADHLSLSLCVLYTPPSCFNNPLHMSIWIRLIL